MLINIIAPQAEFILLFGHASVDSGLSIYVIFTGSLNTVWHLFAIYINQVSLQNKTVPTRFSIYNSCNLPLTDIHFRILHIPGETSDHIGVWLPASGILIAADNFCKSFPNLYAIRGTAPRDVTDWIRSLDKMIELRPRWLISGHYKPIEGEEEVRAILTDYRCAIQYVHDQTVRHINKGTHPDEIAKTVRLHDDFKDNPYLWQVYGTVPWSAKGIYDMYMGWFSGYAVDLNPLTPAERARKMVELVGEDRLLSTAESALKSHEYQWALELASHVFVADASNGRAVSMRRAALKKITGRMTSGNGRHFLMSTILDDSGLLPKLQAKQLYANMPAPAILARIRYRVNAETVPIGEDIRGCFNFTDTSSTICLRLYRSVIIQLPSEVEEWNFKVYLKETTFIDLLNNFYNRRVFDTIHQDILIKGDSSKLQKFFSYIDVD